jgi:hypothetical protein
VIGESGGIDGFLEDGFEEIYCYDDIAAAVSSFAYGIVPIMHLVIHQHNSQASRQH